jgi:hypothetical protein
MSCSVRRSRCVSSLQGNMQRESRSNLIAIHAAADEVEKHLARVSGAAAALAAKDSRVPNSLNQDRTGGGGLQAGYGVPLWGKAPSEPLAEFASCPASRSNRILAPDSARARLWSAVTLAGCLASLSLLAILGLAVMKWPISSWEGQAGEPAFELASSSPSVNNPTQHRSEPKSQLIVHQSYGIAGQPVPLGVTIQGPADGAVVVITGLIPGMSLSSGSTVSAGSWQVPATHLANTWVGPPMGFVGVVELAAELHLSGTSFVHRQPIRIEWTATNPAVPKQVPTRRVREAALELLQPAEDGLSLQKSERAEQHESRTYQRRLASKGAVSTSRKGWTKGSARRRAPIYTLPTQLTRASSPGW